MRASFQHYWPGLLCAALYALGFPGYDNWFLSFFAFVPLLWALEKHLNASVALGATPSLRNLVAEFLIAHKPALKLAWTTGFLTHFACHYWLVEMMRKFSGFPFVLCVVFIGLLMAWHALHLVLFTSLWIVLRKRALPLWVATPVAWVVSEKFFPVLFENFYGNTWHPVSELIQAADLGGPALLSALALLVNALIYQIVHAAIVTKRFAYQPLAAASVVMALLVGYGRFRINDIEQRIAHAPKRRVGVVQVNMGIYEKHGEPMEGLRRHVAQSFALEQHDRPDLIVWPESALAFFMPLEWKNLSGNVLKGLHTPVMLGTLYKEEHPEGPAFFNAAVITDKTGTIRGRYDKTYLLAFGEYLPLGTWLPFLYDLSPRSGHFTPGTRVDALPFDGFRISTLICYEDILPGFVRKAALHADPHVLINMTNDAWFGDTIEPWTHLYLSKFRAVEHHRYMVRSTNSGVSAVVDPLGRVVKLSGVGERAEFSADVAMLSGHTLFAKTGDWPGWLSCLVLAIVMVRKRAVMTVA